MVRSISATSGYFIEKEYEADPYKYQVGFGNQFASEAIPGTLPLGQNSPQKVRFDLYAEQLTATAFVAPRHLNQRTWLYRLRPAVAHQGFSPYAGKKPEIESDFSPSNSNVHVSPTQLAWKPFEVPQKGERINFIEGLKTLGGNGEPSQKSGLAIHIYTANISMEKEAFCSQDGDMLIVPQQGQLNIQTELGMLWVRPGEICVIQRGLRFKVSLPDGPSRGYIQEVYGAHYELPELGPLGANGLANARDFHHPLASFDLDQSDWTITYKLCGQLFDCHQRHTPFDVVAWHGNYVPYKYDLNKFIGVGSITKDHIDPSIFCVLTVPSSEIGTPLADFLIFSPRWDVATETYRPPYYHRNAASEFMGLIYGDYPGRSDDFLAGGASYECGFTPHGVSFEEFEAATKEEQHPQFVSKGSIAFMFESSRMFTLTNYAMTSPNKHEHEPEMWDPLQALFANHLEEVNDALKAVGQKPIQSDEISALDSK
ncbi:hypothetical protein CBS101457_005039 [Exobasidium rhododendri]|nr:hypothetical protein CBS101457_005039 [Exobasidium rhododendri]